MAQRDFEQDTTVTRGTSASVAYTRPDGSKASVGITYNPFSQSTTFYRRFFYQDPETGEQKEADVVARRVSVTTSVLAAINPSLCRSYLENGITPNLSAVSVARTDTDITSTIGRDGPMPLREVVDEYISEFAFAGGVGIQEYVIDGAPVALSGGLVHVSQTITEYEANEYAGITKTKVTRYLAWGTTAEGRDLTAAVATRAETPFELKQLINSMKSLVCDGTTVRTTIGRDFGLQIRPSEQDEERQRIRNITRRDDFEVDVIAPADIDTDWEDIDFDLGLDDDGFTLPDIDDPVVVDLDDWELPTIDPPETPDFGDRWIDADTDTPNIWDGDDWVPVTPDPPENPEIGDKWIDSETQVFTVWTGDDWVPYEPRSFNLSPDEVGRTAFNPADETLEIWNGTNWVPYKDNEPSPSQRTANDRFVDGRTGLEYRWEDGNWVLESSKQLFPRARFLNDLFFDFNTGETYRWDGSDWITTPDTTVSRRPGDRYKDSATGLDYVWLGGQWALLTDTAPSSRGRTVGDVYVDSSTGQVFRWTGSQWNTTGDTFPPFVDEPPGDPVFGDNWINRESDQLETWDGEQWAPYSDAEPPSIGLEIGDRYVASATGVVFEWDGSDWTPTEIQLPTYTIDPPVDPEIGDKWIDRATDRQNVWDGTNWVLDTDVESPTLNLQIGDRFLEDTTGRLFEWDGSDWVPTADIDAPAPGIVIGDLFVLSSSGVEFIWTGDEWAPTDNVWPPYTLEQPEPLAVGDDWFNPADDTYSRWDGSDWVPYSATEPENPSIGDRYIEATTGEERQWDGTDWLATGEEWPPLTADEPTAPTIGDTWFNPVDTTLSLWDGEDFVPYSSTEPEAPSIGDRYISAADGQEFEWDGADWTPTDNEWPPLTSNAPADLAVGDQWINRETGRIETWTGDDWSDLPPFRPLDPAPGETWSDPITEIPFVWDGSDWNAYSAEEPVSPDLNDTWVTPESGIQRQWNGDDWVETGVVFGSTAASNIQLTAADQGRRSVIELPFANDDTLAAEQLPGNIWRQWVAPGGAQAQAIALGQLENAFRYGTTYGANVVVEPWMMPTEPLASFTVRAGGLEVQYLADGVAWEFDGELMVASCDGILCGATGRVSGQRFVPWVAAKVNLSNLPIVAAASVNPDARPANTIPTPAGFRASRPGGIWNILPTNGVDSFEQYGTPQRVYPPFSVIEADRLTAQTMLEEGEAEAVLEPIQEGIEQLTVRGLLDEGEGVITPVPDFEGIEELVSTTVMGEADLDPLVVRSVMEGSEETIDVAIEDDDLLVPNAILDDVEIESDLIAPTSVFEGAEQTIEPEPEPGPGAGFTGSFAPSEWTVTTVRNGSVDFTQAPSQVTLTGPDGDPGDPLLGPYRATMQITAPSTGVVSFDFVYTPQDEGGSDDGSDPFDPFGYVLNGVFTRLSPLGLVQNESSSGSGSFNVTAGDTFGFYAESLDADFGPAVTVVSNFAFTA